MLRIHFTDTDITRLRVAPADQMWENAVRMSLLRDARLRTPRVPRWSCVRERIDAERNRLTDLLLAGGIEGLLNAIHPSISWDCPVLRVRCGRGQEDRRLDGRGLLLQPSFFRWAEPVPVTDPGLPPVLAYPIDLPPDWDRPSSTGDQPSKSLAALVGRTRANVLAAIAERDRNTSNLAGRCHLSVAAASQQAAVLREAGLVESRKDGQSVVHSVTALGRRLLAETRRDGRLHVVRPAQEVQL